MEKIIEICKADDVDSFAEFLSENLTVDYVCPRCPLIAPDILRDAPPICCLTAYFKSAQCLRYLIANDADFTLCDKRKRTIAHFAAAGGSHEIIELLMDININWNSLDVNRNTCIHYAISYHNSDLLYLLWCSQDVDLSVQNARKNTLLHLATACEDIPLIEFLCKNGCNVNSRNDRGLTPLHLAASKPNLNVVSTLIHYGADSGMTDNTGLLPYQIANYSGYQHVCGYLLSC